MREGKGIVYHSNDTIAYEGQIHNGLPHGKGYVYNAKNQREAATWVDGIDAILLPEH